MPLSPACANANYWCIAPLAVRNLGRRQRSNSGTGVDAAVHADNAVARERLHKCSGAAQVGCDGRGDGDSARSSRDCGAALQVGTIFAIRDKTIFAKGQFSGRRWLPALPLICC